MRKHITRALSILALSACLVQASGETASAAKLNLGYLYFGTQDAFVKQVDKTNLAVNRVSPTLFDLTTDGELKLASDISKLVQAMKERGVLVVPFLSNHWDRETGRRALANREVLTTRIAEAVVRYGLNGVNVDIENVTEQDRDAYTDMVRLLREKLPAGSELSVAVAANPNNWKTGWQASYDLPKLAEYSDYLMLMAYDEHWNGDPVPGPVASLGWVEKSVQQALKSVTPDKLVLGIPFYGRYWREGGGAAGAGIPNQTAEALAMRYGIEPRFDETARSAVFTFTATENETRPTVNGNVLPPGTYTVWYENERSIKEKLDLVHKYALRGTGSWALSQESADTWAYYDSWLNGRYYTDAAGHWAEADIRSAAQKGWMTGTGSVSFAPGQPLKRAEAAAVLVRAVRSLGAGTTAEAAVSTGFKDIPAGHWASDEIASAQSMGLVDGYADGTFAPDAPVTREQFAAMLHRALGSAAESSGASAGNMAGKAPLFQDMTSARWSWKAVAALQSKGLVDGYADGTFRPAAPVTRAETAVLLGRSMSLLEAADK
jgi:spore germination protein YaaH